MSGGGPMMPTGNHVPSGHQAAGPMGVPMGGSMGGPNE